MIKYQKTRNLILRILVSPFVFMLIAVKFNYIVFERTIYFLIYGGEWVNYDNTDKATIRDILEEFKKQREIQQTEAMKKPKKLLKTLLHECLKRDFKTLCPDGEMRYTGMCEITDDIEKEGIISKDENRFLKKFLSDNNPTEITKGHWYDSTPVGNGMRAEFLDNHIKLL